MSLIGEMLVRSGIIDQAQLDEALQRQKKENRRLGEILIDLGYISAKKLIWLLSEQANMPFVEVTPDMLDSELMFRFPEKLLRENNLLPLYQTPDRIYVAVGDPTDTAALKKLKAYTTKEVMASGAESGIIIQILEKFFAAHTPENMLARDDIDSTLLSVLDNQAVMEFTDRSGNVTRRKVVVNIEIRVKGQSGGGHE